jgi:hypothetical protein
LLLYFFYRRALQAFAFGYYTKQRILGHKAGQQRLYIIHHIFSHLVYHHGQHLHIVAQKSAEHCLYILYNLCRAFALA